MVEGARLESVYTPKADRGFESLPLCNIFDLQIKSMTDKAWNKLKYFGLSISVFALLFKLLSWQFAEVLLIVGLGSLGVYFLAKIFK